MTAEHSYRGDIDGLRALAVLSVVVFHAFPDVLPGGFVGVDIFFVISGFLITRILIDDRTPGARRYLSFYGRRIRRIFPALVLVLGSCMALGWFVLLPNEFEQLGKHVAAGAGFVSNLVLWSESGYFDAAGETKPLLHLWSLGVEEQFYLVWPFVVWGLLRTKVGLAVAIATIASASFILCVWISSFDTTAAFYSPLTRFWELCAGALLATAPVAFANHRQRHAASALGFVLVAVSLAAIQPGPDFRGWLLILPVGGASLLIAAGSHSIIGAILSTRILVWIGLISYPLYLWHWPLLSFARIVESGEPSVAIRLAAVVVAFVLAILTYWLIERPVRSGQIVTRLQSTIVAASLLALIGIGGLLVALNAGLPFRGTETLQQYAAQQIEQQFQDGCPWTFEHISHCAETSHAGSKGQVVLVGDSHVRHTYEILKDAISQQGYDLIAFSNGGCPFLLGVSTQNDEACALRNREVQEFIEGRGPAVAALLLAGSFTTYTADGWLTKAGEPITLQRAMQETVAALGPREIVLIEQVPPVPFDPKKCIVRPYRITPITGFECSSTRVAVVETLAESRRVISAAIASFPNVTLFNFDDTLCDEALCHARDETGVLYYDATHLNPLGVERVRKRMNGSSLLPRVRASQHGPDGNG